MTGTGVAAATFRQLMDVVPHACRSTRVAVALSGGADSTSLLMLLHEYFPSPENVLAITVDHGLRKESADEARHVATFAEKHGIPHQTHRVQWGDLTGTLPRSQLQVQARLRRYNVLGAVCSREDIRAVYVGHHLGDQLETVLFRLGRGSGWSGLAGMPHVSPFPVAGFDAINVVRPLLGTTKDDLKATCHRFGQEWVEDPSNDSEDFDRIRIRKQLRETTALYGPDLEHALARFQAHAQEAHADLHATEQALVTRYTRQVDTHTIELLDAFVDDPIVFDELAIRVLSGIIRNVGQKDYPPRVASVTLLWTSLKQKMLRRATTIGGCLVQKRRRSLLFSPEHAL
ncbi:Aste57867_8396 [Aphanomyces stellatus]|uniref:tRNA(Ile)-lysidine synthetase n=1 Tax=Aphanomyces stellatus TaxID=120398 RepID=A0A485KK63_9STRA|nr:hypothetical protein As57867_008364 [Aphanomyces stellatus]VFT85282.1 Aste57867_8396 [Aphanomyces stellatus]